MTKPTANAEARRGLPVWLLATALVLATIAAYWPATSHAFVSYDDPEYITANAHVQAGLSWAGVKWAFLSPVCGNWNPVTVLSHMAVCQFFGLQPRAHLLTNVLLHALNAALVFALLQGMTGARWRSLLVAALFALHPLHVESVAWVAERKGVLSSFFGLLALIAYVRYAEDRKQNAGGRRPIPKAPRLHVSRFTFRAAFFYLLSLLWFALGLMSKPMLVTWPFVMLLLDYWPLGRMNQAAASRPKAGASDHASRTTPPASRFTFHVSRFTALLPLLVEKLPFFVLAAVVSVLTFVVQHHTGALTPGESVPLAARLSNAPISYCRYLGKLVWPTHLTVIYPHPGQWPPGEVLLASGLLLGISVLVWVGRRRYPYLLVGWLWYCGTLVPVSQVVQTGDHAMADRYTYLPSIGVLVLALWGAYELTRGWRYRVPGWALAGGAAVLVCLALTRHQLSYWSDSESLFRHAIEVTANNHDAHNNLGVALSLKGQMDEAINQYQEAIREKPDYGNAHYNLGIALLDRGQTDDAIRQFQETIRLKPDHAYAHCLLGEALDRKGLTEEANRQFLEAIRLKPDDAANHNLFGRALDRNGSIVEAIQQFQEAVRLEPGFADARYNLGHALLENGQADMAIGQLQEAVRLTPARAEGRYNLANALRKKGQLDGAIIQYREAIRLKPDFPQAYNNLGLSLAGKGRVDEAISQFQQALRLDPSFAQARVNLADVLASRTASPRPTGGAFTDP